MHLDLKIQELKSYIKILISKLYNVAKTSRNDYIRSLGSDLSAHSPSFP